MQMDACWECVWKPTCAKVVSWQGRGGQELLGRSLWVGGGRCADPWTRSGMGMGTQMYMHIYGGGLDPLASPWPQLLDLFLEALPEPPSISQQPQRES